MNASTRFTLRVALIVALGGFLMGFDASVISGVVGFIETQFALTKIELGWAVASLTLSATLAMMIAGPLSDRIGRRPVLRIAAALFALSALASALAPGFATLVIARMVGGLGVGAALIIAPMYIAEIAPAAVRGRMVSINQLNIVIGISAAFFSNYLVLELGQSGVDNTLHSDVWRWMLAVETVPAIIYLLALFAVPESPRWLVMQGKDTEALEILGKANTRSQARAEIKAVHDSVARTTQQARPGLRRLFHPAMRLVLTVGVTVAVLQQITGINAVFFYAPMIFEQSGVGTDASFMQAVLVGLVNLLFTVLAILAIDRLGRRPLLGFGLGGIATSMLVLAWSFGSATYQLDADAIESLAPDLDRTALSGLAASSYDSDLEFRAAVAGLIGDDLYEHHESELVRAAISMNPRLVLVAILGFVASFAFSLGPVMWVLFSELFPNQLRGIAISFVGLINSAVSFAVQLVFPWELANLGNATTFLIYGLFALAGLALVLWIVPETRGKSLEELERTLIGG